MVRIMANADPEQLRQALDQCPPSGTRFRHYKGGEYVVVGAAILESTLAPAVLYRPAEGSGSEFCWVRPLSNWDSWVEVDGRRVRRFQKLD